MYAQIFTWSSCHKENATGSKRLQELSECHVVDRDQEFQLPAFLLLEVPLLSFRWWKALDPSFDHFQPKTETKTI